MTNFETFKEAVKHYNESAKHYKRTTLWFDEYYCILDNHFGSLKKTIGHSDPTGKVSWNEIEEFYAANKDSYKLTVKRG